MCGMSMPNSTSARQDVDEVAGAGGGGIRRQVREDVDPICGVWDEFWGLIIGRFARVAAYWHVVCCC